MNILKCEENTWSLSDHFLNLNSEQLDFVMQNTCKATQLRENLFVDLQEVKAVYIVYKHL